MPAGVTAIWLRLTKSGTNYQAEVSFNGTTWTNVGAPVTNPTVAPEVRPLHGRRDGAGQTATFDYFKVNGSTGCGGGTEHPAGDHHRHGDADGGLRAARGGAERRRRPTPTVTR